MGEKLMYCPKQPSLSQAGFVLPTSLVLLALLTMLALSVYFGSLSTQKMSAAAQRTTQGYYYAETAANYMQWVLAEDAEMDNYASYPTGSGAFGEPLGNFPTVYGTFSNVGDASELAAYLFNPGPVEISDTTANGVLGQIKYFDNTPLVARAIKWPDAKTNPPVFEDIYTLLPRYIMIEIDATGNITPSIPTLPHSGANQIPNNGAIVWITGGWDDPTTGERDLQIIPLDAYSCAWGTINSTWTAGDAKLGQCDTMVAANAPRVNSYYPHVATAGTAVTYPNGQTVAPYPVSVSPTPLPPRTLCSTTAPNVAFAQACDAYSGWLQTNYRTVIYALGYVNGKPMRLVRKTR